MSESKYQKIEIDKNQTKRLVGIDNESLSQFIEYLLFFDDEEKKEIEKNKVRINRKGGGRKSKLSRNEQILLTLFYLRHHLTFQRLGMMFHVSESTAHNTFNYWQKIMRKALPASLLEQVVEEGENQNDIKEELTKYELLVDTEEQFIERPSVYQEQKKYYSGKKKVAHLKVK